MAAHRQAAQGATRGVHVRGRTCPARHVAPWQREQYTGTLTARRTHRAALTRPTRPTRNQQCNQCNGVVVVVEEEESREGSASADLFECHAGGLLQECALGVGLRSWVVTETAPRAPQAAQDHEEPSIERHGTGVPDLESNNIRIKVCLKTQQTNWA